MFSIGVDVGSTTLKCVVTDENKIIHRFYQRHFSQIDSLTKQMILDIMEQHPHVTEASISISGSAGMGLSDRLGLDFVQEVYATKRAIEHYQPQVQTVVELGGEDAKILFLGNDLEVRMNGSCAGGTGAFIDQMATLLGITADEMDEMASRHKKLYTIASRCGVFAKSDIQPLLNQGAAKPDICASIFKAVVNQTIAGLAQGRSIEAPVAYLGGPLTFLSQLRKSFDESLGTRGICPDDSLYYVALGASLCSDAAPMPLSEVLHLLDTNGPRKQYASEKPLFESREEYDDFCERHRRADVERIDPATFEGDAYLGIDAGSTTLKMVVIDDEGRLLCEQYSSHDGNTVSMVKDFLIDMYRRYPGIHIRSSAATGYGEDLVKNAFRLDHGLVETMAHFITARQFMPDVDFIIDIGGQDIKCFKIVGGVIDNLYLNEACSSGCGSFLQTFAEALGYDIDTFAKLGLFADKPVDLGSRCTVFMNSSVKQAQKDGASIENISAGLSISVVKNALYKVIRATSADSLGEHIVVQGGTTLNDAVLRAFEMEIGRDVVRPAIAALMGAYGAAVYARSNSTEKSSILDLFALERFTHRVQTVTCELCSNHCGLTINTFSGERRSIGGNRCQRPVTQTTKLHRRNIYQFKRKLLSSYKPVDGPRGTLGIPLGLSNYELLPFWHKLFTTLGFTVIHSPFSSAALYLSGQHTIPSDTVCYPAKLMHGHIEWLLAQDVETIFYPCMSYNFDEGLGDNNYNCPIVAYYPEVLAANMKGLDKVRFIQDYVGIHRPKDFKVKLHEILVREFPDITKPEVAKAVDAAYAENDSFRKAIQDEGLKYIEQARETGERIIVLCGRPYHADPEVSHGIDTLIEEFDVAVISEDVLSSLMEKKESCVLNQWTYHARLYAAAHYVATQQDMQLVQLVSFGCGVDAVTTDEVREILDEAGKPYTQIKIDEITNLGTVKIRLRSLFVALDQEKQVYVR